jgi:uncharacterized protein (TIGR03905 family)
MYKYVTQGTCSSSINFDLVDGKIRSLSFEDGCDGNLKAIGVLLEGTDAKEAIKKLKGLRCEDKNTSCADQLAAALELHT